MGIDVSKVTTAVNKAHEELNSVFDVVVKSRQANGLRSLTLAANHLTDAQKNLDKAVQQSTPKVPKGAAVAPVAEGGKKK